MAYILTYGDGVLFDPYTDDVVYDAKLTAKSNNPDYLDFTVPLGHDLYASVEERGEVVRLSWDGVSLFVGEVESVDVDMEGNKEVACVGALEWLNDTVVRPYSTVSGEQPNTAPSSVDGLFAWYVSQHNDHVMSGRKRFEVGVNQGWMLDANNYVYRSSEQLPSTWDEISDKILDELGGYVTVDYGDVLTLSLYADVHETNAQVIDFGVNITDFSSKTDTGDMYTAVRPEGATPDKEEGAEEDPRPITIEGLADGYTSAAGIVKQGDVVYDEDAVRRYGYREYAYSNNDCTTAEGLLTSAVTKLQALMSPTVTVTVKAVDLALYMEGYDHLKVGQAVRVRSALHGIDEYLMVSSVTVDLQDPGNTEYTLGAEYSTLTGQQSSYLKSQTANINKALDTASAMSADAKAAAKDATDASTAAQTAAESAESAAQTAGKAVTTVTVEYAVGDAQAAPTSGWGTATPTRSEGQTVWMRTVTATAEGAIATSEPTPVTGDAGDQGPQGETGPQGAQGIQGIQGEKGEDGVRGSLTLTIHTEPTLGDGRWDYACRIETATVLSESGASDVRVNDQLLYSWSGSKDDFGTMQYEVAALDETYTYTNSPVCLSGVNGADGVGVASIVEQYYQSTSSTKQAGGSWGTSVPTWADGKYVWTRSVITYTDKTTKTTDPVCVTGSKGATGGSGSKGDTGTGVESVDVWYYLSTSATKLDGGSWSTTAPAWVNGKYMWSKTVTTYTDGTSAESAAACITGAKGSTGASQYFHIKYSPVASPTADQMTEEPDVYIGTYVDTTAADSTDPAKYTWSRFQGAQGEKGEQGIQGKSGTDGKTYYLHIAYANSADGKTDFSTTDSAGKSYIGQYTDTTAADSTDPAKYSWTKIKGDTGATGAQGPKGDTGAQGPKGADGKSPTATVTRSGTTATITVNNTDGTSTTATVSDGAKGDKGDAGAGFAWNLLYGTEAFPTSGGGTGNKRRYYTDWQERGVTSKTDDGIKLTLTGNTNDCIFVPMADTSGELLEASAKYTLSFTYRGTLSAAGMFLFMPVSGINYAFTTGASLIGDEQWHDAAITITTPASGSDGLKGCSMLLFYNLAAHKGEYIEVKAKSLKLEKGTAATPWCTTQAETIGADGTDGSSVTAVKLQYAICDSSTTAPTSSWQDSVPDWQTGKYIWQRSATTIKAASGTTTTQYGTAVLYGAFTSLAKSVDGNSSKITQTADALGVTFDSSGNATSTLIRETSDGIEVGKSTDGTIYSGTHTLVGTDAFAIHDKDHNELASFGSSSIDLLQGAGGMQIGKYFVGSDTLEPQFRLCSPKERPIVMQTPASVTSFRSPSARLELAAEGSTYYDSEGKAYGRSINTAELNAGADNGKAELSLTGSSDLSSSSAKLGAWSRYGAGYVRITSSTDASAKTTSTKTASTTFTVFSSTGVGASILATFPMSTLALMLQPRAWRFGENGSGERTWGSTGWHVQASTFNSLLAGADNWSQFFSKSGATLTTKVQGTWKFTQVLHGYATSGRIGASVFAGSSEVQSAFCLSNGNTVTVTNTALHHAAAGTTWTFKEFCESTAARKRLESYLTYLIVEYLGPDPS